METSEFGDKSDATEILTKRPKNDSFETLERADDISFSRGEGFSSTPTNGGSGKKVLPPRDSDEFQQEVSMPARRHRNQATKKITGPEAATTTPIVQHAATPAAPPKPPPRLMSLYDRPPTGFGLPSSVPLSDELRALYAMYSRLFVFFCAGNETQRFTSEDLKLHVAAQLVGAEPPNLQGRMPDGRFPRPTASHVKVGWPFITAAMIYFETSQLSLEKILDKETTETGSTRDQLANDRSSDYGRWRRFWSSVFQAYSSAIKKRIEKDIGAFAQVLEDTAVMRHAHLRAESEARILKLRADRMSAYETKIAAKERRAERKLTRAQAAMAATANPQQVAPRYERLARTEEGYIALNALSDFGRVTDLLNKNYERNLVSPYFNGVPLYAMMASALTIEEYLFRDEYSEEDQIGVTGRVRDAIEAAFRSVLPTEDAVQTYTNDWMEGAEAEVFRHLSALAEEKPSRLNYFWRNWKIPGLTFSEEGEEQTGVEAERAPRRHGKSQQKQRPEQSVGTGLMADALRKAGKTIVSDDEDGNGRGGGRRRPNVGGTV